MDHVYLFRVRLDRLVLLSFDLTKEDRAYVLDCTHMQRERTYQAALRYLASPIPAFEYTGGYSLPELAVLNIVDPRRIRLEEIFPEGKTSVGRLRGIFRNSKKRISALLRD